eukprot:753101-Hanusia_phi.AAC.5
MTLVISVSKRYSNLSVKFLDGITTPSRKGKSPHLTSHLAFRHPARPGSSLSAPGAGAVLPAAPPQGRLRRGTADGSDHRGTVSVIRGESLLSPISAVRVSPAFKLPGPESGGALPPKLGG